MLKPKHDFTNKKVKNFDDIFVNRETELTLFEQYIKKEPNNYNVFMYYGVGGVGKSKLKNKIIDLYLKNNKDRVIFNLDLSITENRKLDSAILSLVDSYQGDIKLRFHVFEIAYAIYFRKKYPGIQFERKKESISEMYSSLWNILSIFDNGITYSTVQIIEDLTKVIHNNYVTKEIKEVLTKLEEYDIKEIEEMLPSFLKYDLNTIRMNKPTIEFLFIIDSFESLNVFTTDELHKNNNEAWLQGLLIEMEYEKFIIFGREKIQWGEEWKDFITCHCLKNLTNDYSLEYLKLSEIKDEKIKEKIIKTSNGYPLYLYLSIKTYHDISNSNKLPRTEDFGNNYTEIIRRFLNNISQEFTRILRVIACLRFYSKEILENIMKMLNIPFNIFSFEEFNKYSFVTYNNNEKFQIHSVLRDGLTQTITKDQYYEINKIAYEYYSNEIAKEITPSSILELVYHASEFMEDIQFKRFIHEELNESISIFQKIGDVEIIVEIIDMILKKTHIDELPIELINIYIDIIHLKGEYKNSVEIADSYISKNKDLQSKDILMMKIRKIHNSMFYMPVRQLINESLTLQCQYKHLETIEYNELLFLVGGNLGVLSGDYEFSRKWLQESINLSKRLNNNDLKKRAIRKYCDSLSMGGKLKEAYEICKSYISGNYIIESRYDAYLLCTLAEIYRKLKQNDLSLKCVEQVEAYTKKYGIKGWLAHSHLLKALLFIEEGMYERSLLECKLAESIYTDINQVWGQINFEIIMNIISKNKGISRRDEKLKNVLQICEEMEYMYLHRVVKDILDNKSIDYYQLLFL